MDAITSTVGTGLIVAVGRWSQEKAIDAKMFVGLGAVAVFLSLIAATDAGLGDKFALLIFISAALFYGTAIGKKLGALK
jgi:hypothetical protein